VPIRVTGTSAAMPPGRLWPKRLRGKPLSKRHRIEVSFGEPIRPDDEPSVLIERVQRFFEDGDGTTSAASPYRRLAARR
jgi:1-acyl-sn-glycerol-3-phosphate acyltransferase